jgi:uncharacterized protein (TIGR02217 family)
MAFFELEFMRQIQYRRVGGPGFSTTVNTSFAGAESRNKNWSLARAEWTASIITPAADQRPTMNQQQFIDALNAFFLNVSGRGDSFRLFDHVDNKATGAILGTGNGTLAVFQLVKTYSIGGRTYTRTIYKPITPDIANYQGVALAQTVVPYFNGTPVAGGAWTVDATTGLVTFAPVPGAGVVVSADCQFHFPVRFDTDKLPIQVEESDVAGGNPIISVNSFKLVETRAPTF